MAWCHACEEKKRLLKELLTDNLCLIIKKKHLRNLLKNKEGTSGFSFRIGEKK